MTRTRVPSNIRRSTKLSGAQRSPFRSTNFRVLENLFFLELEMELYKVNQMYPRKNIINNNNNTTINISSFKITHCKKG